MCHYLLLAPKTTPQYYKKSIERAPMMRAPKEEATTVLLAPVNAAGVVVALAAPVAWTWPSLIWVTTAMVEVGAWTCPSEIWVTGLPVVVGA